MRNFLAVLLFSMAASAAFAGTYDEIPFVSMGPEAMGRGGAAVADARGFDALFYNPAGFSRDPSAFTLSSTNAWVYARPDQFLGLVGQLASGTGTSTSVLSFLNNQVIRGGIGAGASWGIGYVGGGLGLGASIMLDSVMSGPSLLGVTGDLTATIGFIGGLSVPFDVAGFKVHVGGDVRPMIRIHAPLTNAAAVGMLNAIANGGDVLSSIGSTPALYGVGIGLDAGAIAELGWFNVGLSIRDLAGTQFRYNTSSFSVLQGSLGSSLQFPSSGSLVTADQYTIPMDISIGVTFHPDLGTFSNKIDPSVSLDMRNIIGGLAGDVSPWTLIHFGAEARFFSLFTLRAGINQGYLTMGAGLKFFVFDLNFAVFTRELGTHIGDKPLSGMSMNAAIRW
jgi:hypothetical protein